ncbi:MAG: DUF4097 family beta strand repeat-containing protein [Eubacteriales bacterium]
MNTKRTLIANIVVSIILIVVLSAALIAGIFMTAHSFHLSDLEFNGFDSFFGFGYFSGISGESDYSTEPCTVNAGDIKSLNIGWAAGEVRISVEEGLDQVTVSETGDNSKHRLCWELSDSGTLNLRYTQKSGFIIGSYPKKTLTVRLPASVDMNLVKINAYSSSLNADGLNIGQLDYSGASGSIVLKNCTIANDCLIDKASGDLEMTSVEIGGKLDIDNASGGITADSLTVHHISIDTASGKVTLKNTDCSLLNLSSASGGIYFSGTVDRVDQESASGKGEYRLTNVPTEMEFDSASGGVIIYLPADAGFHASLDGASGSISCGFPDATVSKKSAYRNGQGNCTIEMDAASGSLSIQPNE